MARSSHVPRPDPVPRAEFLVVLSQLVRKSCLGEELFWYLRMRKFIYAGGAAIKSKARTHIATHCLVSHGSFVAAAAGVSDGALVHPGELGEHH